MVQEQLAEAAFGKAGAGHSLNDVEVRCGIALDDHRPIFRRSDIPADDRAFGKSPVRALGESAGLAPPGNDPAADLGAAVRMTLDPAHARIHSEVRRRSKLPGR
jgi:hypothetical protein